MSQQPVQSEFTNHKRARENSRDVVSAGSESEENLDDGYKLMFFLQYIHL